MKKIAALVLAVLLFTSGCGGSSSSTASEDNTVSQSSDSSQSAQIGQLETINLSYAKAYASMKQLCMDMKEKLGGIIEGSNYKLEKEHPGDFESAEGYIEYAVPDIFSSVNMAFTADFSEETEAESVEDTLSFFFDSCKFTKAEKNSYKLEYSVSDTALEKTYTGYFTAEYHPTMGSIRFEAYSDISGMMEMTSFVEFVTVDAKASLYALHDSDEQALVKYTDGEITELYYSKNKTGFENLSEVSVYNTPSIYPEGYKLDKTFIEKEKEDLVCMFAYDNGTLSADIREENVTYNSKGEATDVDRPWRDTVTITA